MLFSAIAYLLFIAIMAMCLRCNFFIRSIHHTQNGNVLLSFDDGPHPELTPKILDILKAHNAKAAFFLIGKNAAKHTEIVKRIAAEGHILGSHTYNHTTAHTWQNAKKVVREIENGHREIEKIVPATPRYFRPPFGVTNPNIASALKLLELQSVGWSLRSFDTRTASETKLLRKLTAKVGSGQIVLLHDTQPETVAILPKLIAHIKSKKITLNAQL